MGIADDAKDFADDLKGKVDGVLDEVKDKASAARDAVADKLNEVQEEGGLLDRARDAVTDLVDKAKGKL